MSLSATFTHLSRSVGKVIVMPQDYPMVPERDLLKLLWSVDVGNMLAFSTVGTNRPIQAAQGDFQVSPQRYDRHSDRTNVLNESEHSPAPDKHLVAGGRICQDVFVQAYPIRHHSKMVSGFTLSLAVLGLMGRSLEVGNDLSSWVATASLQGSH